MLRLHLIRHGSTEAMGRILCGRTPGISLNEAGKKQAQALGRGFAAFRDWAGLYVSPVQRARETAEPIAKALGCDAYVDERFSEIDYGEWTGRTFDEVRADPRWERYNRNRSLHAVPGGESLLDVQQRAWAGVSDIVAAHPQGVVGIVTHADVIRALLLLLLAMPLDCIMRLQIAPASVSTVFVAPGSDPIVHQMNATIENTLHTTA